MPERRTASAPPTLRRAVAMVPVAALALLGAAATALAEPALPQLPADGAVVGTVRPSFSWTAGTSGVPISGCEVFVETPAGPVRAVDAPAGTLTATSSVDLPDDGRFRWFVRLTNALGGVASTPVDARSEVWIATPPSPPTIVDGPSGPVRVDRPVFAWTGTRSSSRWVVLDGSGSPVQSGESPTAGGSAPLAPLADGAYVFRATQRNAAGTEGDSAARSFTVDTTAPPAPSPAAAGPGSARATTPAFSWRSAESGAVSTWRVRGAGGTVVGVPVDTTLTGATPKPLPAGAYVFEVRQTDEAGNVGLWGSEPFSIPPSQSVPALGRALGGGRMNLLRRNARRLGPAAGSVVTSRRPVLRWSGAPAGTRLYNLQIFRVGPGGKLIKSGSAFPSGTRYALPAGTSLAPGDCYVWRVWPYRRGAYSVAPLGISDFCIADRRSAS